MANQATSKQDSQKRSKLSQTEFPNNALPQAERIAHAIWDNFAGRGAAPHDIAIALDMSPTSGGWRNLCGSAIAYGLTEGGYAADQITLTKLGRRIVAPTEDGDDARARAEAVLQPRVQREFFEKYNRAKFPSDNIGRNVLVSLGLPKDRAERSFEILKENGQLTGIVRDTKTGPFVAIENPVAPRPADAAPVIEEVDDDELDVTPTESEKAGGAGAKVVTDDSSPKQLFVAHGKNRKPLEDLKKILDQFKIPYKVAIDEPNRGRPISAKVGELMQECSAGIFIFTKDELFYKKNKQGEFDEVWRPSENVVYELGAASIRWERKIIIVREDGVNFPSDFSDLGYITFKDGEIANNAMEIFKELIGLGLVKVMAA